MIKGIYYIREEKTSPSNSFNYLVIWQFDQYCSMKLRNMCTTLLLYIPITYIPLSFALYRVLVLDLYFQHLAVNIHILKHLP